MRDPATDRIVLLAGGVGGAKVAFGLQALMADRLTVIVNTGDDLERHGLLVCPDHDSVLYALAGIDNREWGWGVAGETFTNAELLARYGEDTWFRLGDRDLATHIVRTRLVRDGRRLTEACRLLQRSLGLTASILPMADEPVRTEVRTDDGWLEFQEYFVHRHQEPTVHGIRFRGIEAARATPEVLAALAGATVIVIGPSNPFVSLAPILAVPGLRPAIETARAAGARVVAMSGIIAGRALKGPADRMLVSLGHDPSALGVARLHADLADVFVLDTLDAALRPEVERLGLRVAVTDTVMTDDATRIRVAREVLAAAG